MSDEQRQKDMEEFKDSIREYREIVAEPFCKHKFKERQDVKVNGRDGKFFIVWQLLVRVFGVPTPMYTLGNLDNPDEKSRLYRETELEAVA